MADMIEALTGAVRSSVVTASDRDHDAAGRRRSGSGGGYVDVMPGDDDHRATADHGADHERLSPWEAAPDLDNSVRVRQNTTPAEGK